MKAMHQRWSNLFNDCLLLVFVTGTVGIALKFATFFNQWVYFPSFPNTLDSTFLIVAVVYLAWRTRKHKRT